MGRNRNKEYFLKQKSPPKRLKDQGIESPASVKYCADKKKWTTTTYPLKKSTRKE